MCHDSHQQDSPFLFLIFKCNPQSHSQLCNQPPAIASPLSLPANHKYLILQTPADHGYLLLQHFSHLILCSILHCQQAFSGTPIAELNKEKVWPAKLISKLQVFTLPPFFHTQTPSVIHISVSDYLDLSLLSSTDPHESACSPSYEPLLPTKTPPFLRVKS